MADTNDYLDALNSYQDQISSIKAKVDQVRNYDKQESKFGDAFSFVADPLGAHLLATYGGDAIGNLRNSLSEVTQGIRQTTGLGEGSSLGSGLGESLGLPSGSGLTSGLTDSFSKFMNQFTGPDKSLGDVELTDIVSGDAAPVAESIGTSLASRLSGIASLVTRGPGLTSGPASVLSDDLGSSLMSGLTSSLTSVGKGLGLPSGLPDISELMNLTGSESRVLDVGALAKSYADPMLESVKQSFMDIPEINLTGLGESTGLTSGGTGITDLTAGGEQALSKTVGLAEEGLTPLISGVGEGLEAAGEAVAAAGSEAVIPALVGGLVTAAGLIVSELDKNKERLPTLPNVAAPQFIPGLG